MEMWQVIMNPFEYSRKISSLLEKGTYRCIHNPKQEFRINYCCNQCFHECSRRNGRVTNSEEYKDTCSLQSSSTECTTVARCQWYIWYQNYWLNSLTSVSHWTHSFLNSKFKRFCKETADSSTYVLVNFEIICLFTNLSMDEVL